MTKDTKVPADLVAVSLQRFVDRDQAVLNAADARDTRKGPPRICECGCCHDARIALRLYAESITATNSSNTIEVALQAVLASCRDVLDEPSRAGIQQLRKSLVLESYAYQQITPASAASALKAARAEYQNDEHELDDGADVSVVDAGIWVAGWYWVSNEDLKNHAQVSDHD